MRTLFVLLLSVVSINAFACSCKKVPLAEHIKSSNYIFSAQVTTVEPINKLKGINFDLSGVRAQFIVHDVLKGKPQKLPYLYSGYGGGDCGLQLKPGDKYLFFTSTGYVSICAPNVKSFDNVGKLKEIKSLINSKAL